MGQQEAPGRVDGHGASGAVRTGARQDHANGVIPLFLGQRTQEDVDGQRQQMGFFGGQLKMASDHPHDRARWNQIDVIGFNRHALGHDLDHHPCVTPDQVLHHAFVVGRQVLDDHEGRSRVGGAVVEEPFQGLQATGRGTDGNHETREGAGACHRGRLWSRLDDVGFGLLVSIGVIQGGAHRLGRVYVFIYQFDIIDQSLSL